MFFKQKNKAFTLVELLVVIAIIGILSTISVVALGTVRSKARDAVRLSDMKNIQDALMLYYDSNDVYPTSDRDGCCGWDIGNQDYTLLGNGELDAFLSNMPSDQKATGNCTGYRYYRYNAGSYGCDVSRGAYYVLGVVSMESSDRPHESSVG